MKRIRITFVLGVVAPLSILLFLGAFAAVDASSLTILGKFDGTGYRTEIEVVSDPGAYFAVGVDLSGGTQFLEPDAGEIQWDIESDNISLLELNGFLGSDILLRFITNGGGTESVYTLAAPVSTDLVNADFPDRATNLNVTLSANPSRPTATWTGGDPTADLLFLTYQDVFSFDEFGDAPLDPSTNPTTYTLQQDLAAGSYEATLAYWGLFSNPELMLTSGPDVFSPAANDVALVLVGETLFSPVVIPPVPVPAAVWLFGSSLVLLGWVRRKAV
jgi:hypothetical protein